MKTSLNVIEQAKILIVDDEPQNLQLVAEILRLEGMLVILSIQGDEAIEIAREQQPALILLDIMMPGLDGLTVCKMLKSDQATKSIPIIFLTAATEVTDLVSAFVAGGVDYIKKPFIREELLARVQTHISLNQARQQLKALYQQKTDLLTTLAHDIKNPTGAIDGLATLMIEDIKEDKHDTHQLCSMLELTRQSARGMTEFVNEILDKETRNQGEIPELTEAQINVAEIVAHLVKLNAVQSNEKSIRLTYEPTFKPMVHISQRILTGMFDNIISNAVKYSRNNSKVIVHLMPSQLQPNGFRFEVHDNASVISPENSKSIFKKFAKSTEAPIGKSSSHGIGLAIVKRLVDLYNGDIGVRERVDGEGNVFYIEIPLES
ncbi:MAG: hybrid sensor histidine kinase/response regulator [Opitutae bacterium]|nr:hybrid sensor histidine kinase/response regulator [Opitutae bacterium]MDG1301308.1 hybrid sensor histidine kinase/response regulator [Opitutae bacterium]